MKEKITEIIKAVEFECAPCLAGKMEDPEVSNCANEIIDLISEEIEKMKNPYPDTMAFRISHPVFEDCRQAILNLLNP